MERDLEIKCYNIKVIYKKNRNKNELLNKKLIDFSDKKMGESEHPVLIGEGGFCGKRVDKRM